MGRLCSLTGALFTSKIFEVSLLGSLKQSMTLAERFNNWDEFRKNVFVLSAFAILVTALLLPFCFFNLPGVPFGFLVGSIVSLIAYLTIVKGSSLLLSGNGGAASAGLTVLFVTLRLALYGGILVLAAFCTFRWNFAWLNFWGVFAGIVPMPILISVMEYLKRRKATKEPSSLRSDPSMFKGEEASEKAIVEEVSAAPIEEASVQEIDSKSIALDSETTANPSSIEKTNGEDVPLDLGEKSNG